MFLSACDRIDAGVMEDRDANTYTYSLRCSSLNLGDEVTVLALLSSRTH